jgi:hypothetical protein
MSANEKVAELIAALLSMIQKQFYQDRLGDFLRDQTALMKAISRYGYECHQRGWEFDVPHLRTELFGLLNSIRKNKTDFEYLPVYLNAVIGRHIGQRAEELSAQAKSVPRKVAKIVTDAQTKIVSAVREPSATEIMAILHRDTKKRGKARPKPEAQPQLFT